MIFLNNKNAAIERLQQQMDEIETIKDRPRFGDDFTRWYDRTITTIADIFGEDSEEVKEFQSIKLELPESFLPEELLEAIKTVAHEDIEILNNREQRYYEERLYELCELLLAMIIKLKKDDYLSATEA